jgi:hypothetical protein
VQWQWRSLLPIKSEAPPRLGFILWYGIAVQRKVIGVKSILVAVSVLFSAAAVGYLPALEDLHNNIASDGEYVGLEKMPNLTPEDRDAAWFHENRLLIRNDEAILDKVPIIIRHGKTAYSASDGGFLTFRAQFRMKDGQSFVALRLFESDYIGFVRNKNGKAFDPYAELKTYPVKFFFSRIEIEGVEYRRKVLDKIELDRLVQLLSAEPLEKTSPDNRAGRSTSKIRN